MKSVITFYGGAGTVTGANFMLETAGSGSSDVRMLVDCGILQAKGAYEFNKSFAYNPSEVEVLVVTHAHADHLGRVPKLVREGFNGVIYSTPATKDLAVHMFADALKIMAEEAREKGYEPLYTQADVTRALSLWQTVPYYSAFTIGDMQARFLDAGHILGSAMLELTRAGKKLIFTGDLGNSPAPLLRDTDQIEDVNYLLMESVYGDRDHEEREHRVHKLAEALARTHKRGGTLLIPAFSMQRTQILIYEINKLVESGTVPEIPVYLDSPLARKVTEVYSKHIDLLNERVQSEIRGGDDIFNFPQFTVVKGMVESQHIMNKRGAKVIIAGSGMSVGGRILAHERAFLGDKRNAILFVGYQAVHTLGRQIQDGNKVVRIGDDKVRVRARIDTIRGFSAHKDRTHLIEFVAQTAETLDEVFVTMGEPRSSLHLVQRLRDNLGVNAKAPALGERAEINF